MIDFEKIPILPQRQDSLHDQLVDLHTVANRLGMYDAADAIVTIYPKVPVAKWGCHCDLDEGEAPDACVLDTGKIQDCIYAKAGMNKVSCTYWRKIKEKIVLDIS